MRRSLLGVVLAGGMSRRMGVPKASLRLPDNRTMLETAFNALFPVCNRLAMIGGNQEWLDKISIPVTFFSDIHPGEGPLAGVETALFNCEGSDCIIVGCDQPLLTTDLLLRLIEGNTNHPRVFCENDQTHPLPGFFPANILPQVVLAMANGTRSVQTFLASAGVEIIKLGDKDLSRIQSFNTPEQFSMLANHCELKSASR